MKLLQSRDYPSDPVKKWKRSVSDEVEGEEEGEGEEGGEGREQTTTTCSPCHCGR